MGRKLLISSSPHIKGPRDVHNLMLDVILSLVPATVASVWIFGQRALLIILVSVVTAVVSEVVYEKAVKREVTANDLTACITGLLLALSLPPGVPLYVPVVGAVFAVVIAKQVFGGLGTNFVNPALAGRAFVMAAWPLVMTGAFIAPFTHEAVSGATPLPHFVVGQAGIVSLRDLFIGNRLGCIGETSIAALLLGGIYLIVRDVIDWRLPLGYLATLSLGSWIFGKPGSYFHGDGLTAVLLGGAMLGAFFMATDYVTSPVTPKGRLYMGIGAGLITVLIRYYGGFPEGVTYGILLMNLVTPLIDKFVVPKYYGYAHDEALRRKARAGGR